MQVGQLQFGLFGLGGSKKEKPPKDNPSFAPVPKKGETIRDARRRERRDERREVRDLGNQEMNERKNPRFAGLG